MGSIILTKPKSSCSLELRTHKISFEQLHKAIDAKKLAEQYPIDKLNDQIAVIGEPLMRYTLNKMTEELCGN